MSYGLFTIPSHWYSPISAHRSFPCGSASDAQTLRNLVIAHASHPNQLLYDSRAFVSTFSGESCTFGQSSAPDGWKNEFAGHPDLLGKIYFVPAFFIDPTKFGDFRDVMDGDFNVCIPLQLYCDASLTLCF